MKPAPKSNPAPPLRTADAPIPLGAASAFVVHELRNALAVVSSSLFLAKRDRANEAALLGHIENASSEVRRAQETVTAVLALSRGGEIAKEPTEVRAIFETSRRACERKARATFSIEVEPADLRVPANPILLTAALSNLFENALDALADRDDAEIVLRAKALEKGLEIIVEDNGPGIASELREEVFEPAKTTKTTGAGLGLALVRASIEAHGGTVDVGAREDGKSGASFRIVLPS